VQEIIPNREVEDALDERYLAELTELVRMNAEANRRGTPDFWAEQQEQAAEYLKKLGAAE
jgi:hypothetical protein